LDELIGELNRQKSEQKSRVYKKDAEFKSLVEDPRDSARQNIKNLRNQIAQTEKLKEYLADDEVRSLKREMRKKVREQIDSIRKLSPMEVKVVQARHSLNARFEAMEKGITNLMSFRDSFKDMGRVIDEIRSTINSEVVDWDYVQRAHRDRALIGILNEFTEVEEEIKQLTDVTYEVAKLLPPAPQQHVLTAAA
jgi:hypothetical protein